MVELAQSFSSATGCRKLLDLELDMTEYRTVQLDLP